LVSAKLDTMGFKIFTGIRTILHSVRLGHVLGPLFLG
jgi:hypothetical protein